MPSANPAPPCPSVDAVYLTAWTTVDHDTHGPVVVYGRIHRGSLPVTVDEHAVSAIVGDVELERAEREWPLSGAVPLSALDDRDIDEVRAAIAAQAIENYAAEAQR